MNNTERAQTEQGHQYFKSLESDWSELSTIGQQTFYKITKSKFVTTLKDIRDKQMKDSNDFGDDIHCEFDIDEYGTIPYGSIKETFTNVKNNLLSDKNKQIHFRAKPKYERKILFFNLNNLCVVGAYIV